MRGYLIPGMNVDRISVDEAATLPGLVRRRCERTPEGTAYIQFDQAARAWKTYTWSEVDAQIARWQFALAQEWLQPGDRVAVLLKSCAEWVFFDLAAQALGLVVVPLYPSDRPDNVAYILADSSARLLLVGEIRQWLALVPLHAQLPQLRRVLCLNPADQPRGSEPLAPGFVVDWLPRYAPRQENCAAGPEALATIVYTSGTTGRPKGVMLSHRNILCDAAAVLGVVPAYCEDVLLSFLPLSHAYERTVGCYLPVMAGACVAYCRGLDRLADDLLEVRPTVLVSVPRIYEMVHGRLQRQLQAKGWVGYALFRQTERIGWRHHEARQGSGRGPNAIERLVWPALKRLVADKLVARFGGRLRVAVCGGAPLSEELARTLLALGVPLLQGYGLTEAAPVVSANRLEDNVPGLVGAPLPGVEVRIASNWELLVRGPNVMLGYWRQPDETARAIDPSGWLHTGDQASFDPDGHIRIQGRLKEVIVMSSGEKISPSALETALVQDPLIEQAFVVGEGKPFLAALLVLNAELAAELAGGARGAEHGAAWLGEAKLRSRVLKKCNAALREFPVHARLLNAWFTLEPWTIDNGLLTPSMKIKRAMLELRFREQIRELFEKHDFTL